MLIIDAGSNDRIDHFLDFLDGGSVEATRSTFDRIGDTNDGRLFAARTRAGVAEKTFIHIRNIVRTEIHDFAAQLGILLLVASALIKVFDAGGAVVFANDIEDDRIEAIFDREIDALFDMRNDDEGTHRGREGIVGILALVDIFREVVRFNEFADVVKVSGDTADGRVGTDFFGRGFREVGDGKAMVIGSRGFHAQAFEQGVVEVCHFQPRNIGGQTEDAFENGEESAHEHGGEDTRAKSGERLEGDELPVGLRRGRPRDGTDLTEDASDEEGGGTDIDASSNQPTPATDLESGIDGSDPRNQRKDEEGGFHRGGQESAPDATKDRGVETMLFAENHGENHRGEGIGEKQGDEARVDVSGLSLQEDRFDGEKLEENDAQDEGEPRIRGHGKGVVNPKLPDGGKKDEENDDEIFERLGVFAREAGDR